MKLHLKQLSQKTSGMITDTPFQQRCARYKGTTKTQMC